MRGTAWSESCSGLPSAGGRECRDEAQGRTPRRSPPGQCVPRRCGSVRMHSARLRVPGLRRCSDSLQHVGGPDRRHDDQRGSQHGLRGRRSGPARRRWGGRELRLDIEPDSRGALPGERLLPSVRSGQAGQLPRLRDDERHVQLRHGPADSDVRYVRSGLQQAVARKSLLAKAPPPRGGSRGNPQATALHRLAHRPGGAAPAATRPSSTTRQEVRAIRWRRRLRVPRCYPSARDCR